jgi:hypothetical protein
MAKVSGRITNGTDSWNRENPLTAPTSGTCTQNSGPFSFCRVAHPGDCVYRLPDPSNSLKTSKLKQMDALPELAE